MTALKLEVLGAIAVSLGALLLLERLFPFKRTPARRGRVRLTNVGAGLLGGCLSGAWVAVLRSGADRGDGGYVPIAAGPLEVLWGVLVLDLTLFLWHVALHEIPPLWTLHRFHHEERFLDATTSLRIHPVESLLGHSLSGLAGHLAGVAPEVALLHGGLVGVWSALQHANVAWPAGLERVAGLLLVTPSRHALHHDGRESRPGNYATLLSLWDILFGTRTNHRPRENAVPGLGTP